MSDTSPLAKLYTLGEPDFDDWLNYGELGIGSEHVPDLIGLATNRALMETDNDSKHDAPLRSMRFSRLRRPSAITPARRSSLASFVKASWRMPATINLF